MTNFNEITGKFWYSFEKGSRLVNGLSKVKGIYFTLIKGNPHNNLVPEQCWAISNKYDPKVIEFERRKREKDFRVGDKVRVIEVDPALFPNIRDKILNFESIVFSIVMSQQGLIIGIMCDELVCKDEYGIISDQYLKPEYLELIG